MMQKSALMYILFLRYGAGDKLKAKKYNFITLNKKIG